MGSQWVSTSFPRRTVDSRRAARPAVTPPPTSPAPPDQPPPAAEVRRAVVPPLVPILLPLVLAAIVLGFLFAWLFPGNRAGPVPVARFTNVTAEAGVEFAHHQGAGESPTTLGAGVVVLDFDRDGAPDLFFANGAPWPWEESLAKAGPRQWPALYRNDGRGRFTDVTLPAGLNVELQAMGAAAGDFDGDGFPDLFVACLGANHLFRNRGNGTFEDVTDDAGVGGDGQTWSTAAVWIDFDHDGRLDLVVAAYARWSPDLELQRAFRIAEVGRSYGDPAGFVPAIPTVYRNLGDGRFAEVPDAAGLHSLDADTGLLRRGALAVAPVDANGDARLDLLFTFQAGPAVLFLDAGNGTFREWSGDTGRRREGSSVDLALSGALPFARGGGETLALQQALAAGDAGPAAATAIELAPRLGFALLDYDLDGRLDGVSGRGRLEAELGRFENGRAFAAAPALLFESGAGWVEGKAAAGDRDWEAPWAARGIAVADLDGDGDGDVVLTQHNGPAQILRNDQRHEAPWLRVVLEATRSHREAGGARVELHTPRHVLARTIAPAMGFMAQSQDGAFFGLGDDARVRRLVIHWPSGQRQELQPGALNRTLLVQEP